MNANGEDAATQANKSEEILVAWPNEPSAWKRFGKVIIDYAIVLPTMIVFSPIFLLIVLTIKRSSAGPVFSRGRYLSRRGREFKLLTFRTVYVEDGEETAVFTPVGRILYQFKLDMVPQFLHVLKRDMSLVGPSPLKPEELGQCHHCGNTILCVLPGLTGLWQIKSRHTTSFQERTEADLIYITEGSFWWDLNILFATILAVLK